MKTFCPNCLQHSMVSTLTWSCGSKPHFLIHRSSVPSPHVGPGGGGLYSVKSGSLRKLMPCSSNDSWQVFEIWRSLIKIVGYGQRFFLETLRSMMLAHQGEGRSCPVNGGQVTVTVIWDSTSIAAVKTFQMFALWLGQSLTTPSPCAPAP